MVRYCIVCKKEAHPFDKTRILHKFPNDNDLRQKWMCAVGRTTVTKTATICSDHFKSDSFHPFDENTRMKRLLSNAVPIPCVTTTNEKVLSNVTNKNVPSTSTENVTATENNLNKDMHNILIDSEFRNLEKAETFKMKSLGNDDYVPTKKSNFQSECHKTDLSSESNDYEEELDNILVDSESQNAMKAQTFKRICSSNYAEKTKKFRFTEGFQSYQVTKEDFVSDEAWNRFFKLMEYKNRQISVLRGKHLRKEKKINDLQQLIKLVNKEKATATAEYLNVQILGPEYDIPPSVNVNTEPSDDEEVKDEQWVKEMETSMSLPEQILGPESDLPPSVNVKMEPSDDIEVEEEQWANEMETSMSLPEQIQGPESDLPSSVNVKTEPSDDIEVKEEQWANEMETSKSLPEAMKIQPFDFVLVPSIKLEVEENEENPIDNEEQASTEEESDQAEAGIERRMGLPLQMTSRQVQTETLTPNHLACQ